jgi:molecular chaperone GrpE
VCARRTDAELKIRGDDVADNIEEKEFEEAVQNEEEQPGESMKASEEENIESAGGAAEEEENSGEEEELEEEASQDDNVPKERKSFFKKKEKKDKRDEKIEELNDRLIRQIAEFDNFRKRTEKEKSQMFEIGAKDIVEKILPVVDNFERGLATVPDAEKESAFVQGIELVYKQLMKALEDAGVKPIEAVGKEFDPNFHNAVMHAEDENFGENIVSEEFQKGYIYRDSVVRHSMVKVVN